MENESGYILKSLTKGLEVLQVISEAETPLLLSEISKKTSTNMVRATRILRTFEKSGYIYRDSSKRYNLSPKMLSLGYSFVRSVEWIDIAQYYMTALYQSVGGIVSLTVMEEREIVYLARIRDREFISLTIQVGARLPVHCTAMGKVMLAYAPPETRDRIVGEIDFKMNRLTSFTIASREDFTKELARIIRQGYALNDEELALGNRAIAAPILNERGYAVAAVGVALQTIQYSREEIEKKISKQVIACATKISDDLQKLADSLNVSVDHFVKQSRGGRALNATKRR